jgi:hypothetical protein
MGQINLVTRYIIYLHEDYFNLKMQRANNHYMVVYFHGLIQIIYPMYIFDFRNASKRKIFCIKIF